MGCQKGCSIFWCFLFMLSGLMLLAEGIWMITADRVYDTKVMESPDLMENSVPWTGTVGGLMAVGIYNFLVGVLGMTGAGCDLDKKVKNSLIAFAVFASIGVIAVIIYSSLVAYQFATTEEATVLTDIEDNLRILYTHDEGEQLNAFEEAWNRYQVEEKCCGVISHSDYEDGAFWNVTSGTDPIPWSCCVLNPGVDSKDASSRNDVNYTECVAEYNSNTDPWNLLYLHNQGCGAQHWSFFRAYQVILLATGWTSVLVELIAMFVSGCLRTRAGENFVV